MLVPATDPAALAAGLGRVLDGIDAPPLTLATTADHVRLSYWRGHGPSPAPRRLAAAPPTPARELLLSRRQLVAVQLRHWMVAPAAEWAGVAEAAEALRGAAPEYLEQLRWAALGLVGMARVMMTAEGAAFDDHVFTFDGADALRIGAVASLTPLGRRAFEAGRAAGGAPPTLPEDASARLSFSHSLPALFEAAGPSPGLLWPGSDARAGLQRAVECGTWCAAYHMLRSGPSAARVVWEGEAAERLDIPLPVAAAAALWVEAAEPSAGALRLVAADGQTVDKAWGERARGALGPPAPTPPDRLLSLDVESVAVTSVLHATEPRLSSLVVGGVRGHVSLAPSALVGEVVAHLGAGTPAPALRDWRYAARDWESPDLAAETSPRGRCAAAALRALSVGLQTLAFAAPELRPELRATLRAEVEERARCASPSARTVLSDVAEALLAPAGPGR